MYNSDDLVEPPPLSRRRRWLRVLLVFATFGAVALGIYGYLWFKVERDLQAVLEETTLADPRWRLPDMQADRAVIPDERNSATVIVAAKGLMPAKWPSWDYPDPNATNQDGPGQQKPLAESFQDLEPQRRMSDAQAAVLRDELKRAEKALAQARKLADLSEGRHAITYSADFYSTLLPTIQDTRQVAALLANDALSRAQDGDADGALASCRGVLNAGRSIGDEPVLIGQLVRLACRTLALSSIQRVLAQGEPSAEALRQLQQLLEKEELEPLLLIALRGERAGIDQLMEAVLAGKADLSSIAGETGQAGRLLDMAPSPFLKGQRAALLRFMNRVIEVAQKPLAEQHAAFQQLEQEARTESVFVRILVPAVSKVAAACQRSHAQLRCAIALIAAERYRRANGRWPESLQTLKEAALLSQVPTDPYDGQPLRYRRLDDGVVIYSVGPDGRDDGGNLDPQNPLKPGTDLGYRLWDVAGRAQPPLPQRDPK